ncbi:bifunctional phosphopantothenoylcysteine decarboxylase/phosphopantothenate--cysteine ligase CoaBC [Sphingopyxis alaskensis]|jgi:phosphopantothenoylcysteine decarboxylase/phosphopantothenate--cysteine ligase|uniref:Coenzyme A biosynthesis bifunctional protein CoaBC n=1 Tax=Sphingopyxis alaskensis (strain DSM 13593 / LMG 18877 / RB2256) TaxID=317655 RepID=Q1GN87_SPHAL|nr:bifunctional phosphopantothenoylcysteine decarboxylase/phosphopantothenate--cysteine ligase CoaBC [Sphingopyxis alaskensis]ABF54885.1 Phosphopantothenate-cysteine ligase / Phosphopantothenoylcysteine decarboxylase [Sphingopyxis alaskensis RB2256]MCM3419709.1 bifunctional phosphopantothenoylcysteine decarboxylase/phosphopantothenate--cysteine ligase CoaBC [Sphingopyxis alaskensis]
MTRPRILLIVGGGIAAYKSVELVRLLRKADMTVRCVLTRAGEQFVTPLTLAALSENKVYTSLFDLTDEVEMGHIQLSREADLVVVAPATADLMARMAAGIADDLATTLLLATDKPVLAAPAMNVRMWLHPATQRNIAALRGDGVTVMEPDEGEMACGEYGPGRLPEPDAIFAAIEAALANAPAPSVLSGQPDFAPANHRPLHGRRILITAGPTHEPIDPVRYIANRSSGKQGFAIAAAAAEAGAEVLLIAGPVPLPTPPGVIRVDVETAVEMATEVEAGLPVDAAIMVAAVADWRAAESQAQKIKKDGSGRVPPLALAENPDILASVAQSSRRPPLLIGFAAETNDVIAHAEAKLARKGCDWIVANDVSADPMGGESNRVHIVSNGGVDSWDRLPKAVVARKLMEKIADELDQRAPLERD